MISSRMSCACIAAASIGCAGVFLAVRAYHGAQRQPADAQLRIGVADGGLTPAQAMSRLTTEQQHLVDLQPTAGERDFLARVLALRDHLTGEPGETEFAVQALTAFTAGKDRTTAAEAMSFTALGFLARAQAQKGIPAAQRERVLSAAVELSKSSDDATRVLVAALLGEMRRGSGVLKPQAAEDAYTVLMNDEYVKAEIQGQLDTLEAARKAAG